MKTFRIAVVFFLLTLIVGLAAGIDLKKHWQAVFYVLILFGLSVGPMILILSRRQHGWLVTLLLTPALILSLDTFFLRLGLYNIFVYSSESWHPAVTRDILIKACWLASAGNLAFWLGYSLPISGPLGQRLGERIGAWAKRPVRVSELGIWVLYFIGLAARFYILSNNLGGFFSFNAEAQQGAAGYIQYIGLVENLSALSLVVFFCVQLTLEKRASWGRFGVMLALELVTVFLMGFKGQVIYRFIYLALAYVYLKRDFSWKIVVGAALALALIMPVNLLMRSQYIEGESDIQQGQAGTILSGAVEALDEVLGGQSEFTFASVPERFIRQSAQMQDFALMVQYVDRTGYSLRGQELLNIFFAFIPRAIWPSKPPGALGGWFTEIVYGQGATGASAITVPGDFYLNFGWLGVPLGFLVYGGLLRLVGAAVLQTRPGLRMAAMIPYIILGLGMPSSELGSHLGALIRQLLFFSLVITFLLLPVARQPVTKTYRRGVVIHPLASGPDSSVASGTQSQDATSSN